MGPLAGFRIIELAGIGPTQFCGMLLADMGATVLSIARPASVQEGFTLPPQFNLMNRSRFTITVDLARPAGRSLLLALCKTADALFEGYRPGVMEALQLGPAQCMAENTRLVYGRMTGWGQDGPLAASAGHDANYAALSGAIAAIGPADSPPVLPLNLVADFGGGGAYLAIGLLAAILEASRSGEGQVVDAAMTDGAASLMTLFYGLHAGGLWQDTRGNNLLDGGAPFYRAYETLDGRHVVVCALEPKFFRQLLAVTAVEDIAVADQFRKSDWQRQHEVLAEVFRRKTRDEWCEQFKGSDGCVSPVLSLAEAPQHPHNRARETFVEIDGIVQPAPAPRFSRSRTTISKAASAPEDTPDAALRAWGLPDADIAAFTDGCRT